MNTGVSKEHMRSRIQLNENAVTIEHFEANNSNNNITNIEDTNFSPEFPQQKGKSSQPLQPIPKSKPIYVLPDTNAFLSYLSCIQNSLRRGDMVTFHVPNIVKRELEKQSISSTYYPKALSEKAQDCLRFLNAWSLKLKLQSREEDSNFEIQINENDDRIVSWAIKLKNRGNTVIVLTEDIGLSIKLRACLVNVLSAKSISKMPIHNFPLEFPE